MIVGEPTSPGSHNPDEGYEYDIFVSYSRNGNVLDWVSNHFVPVLDKCLTDELPHPPLIFLDVAQEPGVYWPQNLERALSRSRLLVSVLSPPYFESPWCTAEWETMVSREQQLGLGCIQDPRSLIYAIRYSDGASFPPKAHDILFETSFSGWRYPYPQFSRSEKYLAFHDAVTRFAERIAQSVRKVPEWQPNWPVVRPDPAPPSPSRLPRLWSGS